MVRPFNIAEIEESGLTPIFRIPTTLKIGAVALIVVFALAALVHILQGQYDIGNLIIYTAATWMVMANSTN